MKAPQLSLLNKRHLIVKAGCCQLFTGSPLDVPGKQPSLVLRTCYKQCTDTAHIVDPSRQQKREQLVATIPHVQRYIRAEHEVSRCTELQLTPLKIWSLLLDHEGF